MNVSPFFPARLPSPAMPTPSPAPNPLAGLAGRVRRRLTLSHLVPTVVAELRKTDRRLDAMDRRLRDLQQAVGRVEGRQVDAADAAGLTDPADLHAHEFKVASQWGEDGILRHLCRAVPVPRKLFVEFGVENYEEANTRFLLADQNWSGLVLDGDEANVEQIRRSRIYWMHNLKAASAFVTAETIDGLLRANGVEGEIGLYSVDVDGMDHWIWRATTAVSPAIVAIEYNHRYGPDDAVVVPYDPAFDRRKADPSLCYYGASLAALVKLADAKGYGLVGCNSNGLNAFFVRRDLLAKSAGVREVACADGFVAGRFSEFHEADGRRVKVPPEREAEAARSGPLERV